MGLLCESHAPRAWCLTGLALAAYAHVLATPGEACPSQDGKSFGPLSRAGAPGVQGNTDVAIQDHRGEATPKPGSSSVYTDDSSPGITKEQESGGGSGGSSSEGDAGAAGGGGQET